MVIRPQPGPQEMFLSSSADIALYGGAAGGGKTFALLVEGLRHCEVPGFHGLIFRRNAKMIKNTGGLWDESLTIYSMLNATARSQMADWTFASGASIKFDHLELDSTIYSYQGAQCAFIGFDELTHFTEKQFFYMLSRNRSTCGVRPYVRATTNPDKLSWVRKLVDWWIGEDGLPIQERSGIIRWFVRKDGKLLWADTKEELEHISEPKSFTFIPATLSDNQILMQRDGGYKANLMALDIVERARLLDGNWNIDYSDYGVVLSRNDFFRYDFEEQLRVPGFFTESYFVLDSASRAGEANDYSVLGLFAKCRFDQRFYIVDWVRVKVLEPDLEQIIIDKWSYWKPILKPKGINIEDKSSGQGLLVRLPRRGIPCFRLTPDKDKFHRLNDNLGAIKSKWVGIPYNVSWADAFFIECECFRADLKHVVMDGEVLPHDDQVDTLAYGISTQVNKSAFVEIVTKKKPDNGRRKFNIYQL